MTIKISRLFGALFIILPICIISSGLRLIYAGTYIFGGFIIAIVLMVLEYMYYLLIDESNFFYKDFFEFLFEELYTEYGIVNQKFKLAFAKIAEIWKSIYI